MCKNLGTCRDELRCACCASSMELPKVIPIFLIGPFKPRTRNYCSPLLTSFRAGIRQGGWPVRCQVLPSMESMLASHRVKVLVTRKEKQFAAIATLSRFFTMNYKQRTWIKEGKTLLQRQQQQTTCFSDTQVKSAMERMFTHLLEGVYNAVVRLDAKIWSRRCAIFSCFHVKQRRLRD